MSYDLSFWKQRPDFVAPPQEIYEKLSEQEEVDGLEELPIEALLQRIRDEFPGSETNKGTVDWEGSSGAFQVSWSKQHVRVDCYGLAEELMNKFIDIALEFGCPLYDPQVGQRFD